MSDSFSKIDDWVRWDKEAVAALGGENEIAVLVRQEHFYDDRSATGHVYWWFDGLVAVAPSFADGTIDTGNVAAAGYQDGAEPDLYGRECLISAELAERVGNEEVRQTYLKLSRSYFDEAKRTGCHYWPLDEVPPV